MKTSRSQSALITLSIVLASIGMMCASTFAQPGASPDPDKRKQEKQALLDELTKEIKANSDRLKALGSDAPTAEVKAKPEAIKEAQIKDMEAKINALTKQLQEMKSRKVVGDESKEAKPLKIVIGDGKWFNGSATFNLTEEKGSGGNKPGQPKPAPFWGQPLPGANPWQPAYRVIGPDGQEIKGAKVIPLPQLASPQNPAYKPLLQQKQAELEKARRDIVKTGREQTEDQKKPSQIKPAPGTRLNGPYTDGAKPIQVKLFEQGSQAITLSRATYKLPYEKAEALVGFLKTNLKTQVLEFKFQNDGVVITTTPDVQAGVGTIVKLMQEREKKAEGVLEFKFELKE